MVQAGVEDISIGMEDENVFFFFSFWSLSESPIRRMGFENPLNPSYYPSNGASDLPTYFGQRSLRATPKVKHESPQTIIWNKIKGKNNNDTKVIFFGLCSDL